MKKIIAFLLVGVMLLSLAACSSSEGPAASSPDRCFHCSVIQTGG